MPFVVECAAVRRGMLLVVVAALGLGSALSPVAAQETVPPAGPAALASGGETVLLRDQPGWEAAVVTPLGDGSALDVTGAPVTAADGSLWLPVAAAGQSGYVPSGYVVSGAAAPVAAEALPTEGQPAADPALVAEPAPVSSEPEPIVADPAAAPAGNSMTTTDANLRAAPSPDAEIAQVLPPGSAVTVNGPAENGFVPVTANGVPGWIAAELLAQGTESIQAPPAAEPVAAEPSSAEPAPLVAPETGAPGPAEPAAPVDAAPRERDRQSTGIIWPMSGGEWEVVQGYNNGTHTNRSGFAQYKYSLDWARVDGDTAGQPVFAPVSGTVEWVDRGSGGLLIDAGNGYGVALFHITLDGIGRGDSLEQGQRIGRISGPGGDGYMSMAHIDITCWRLTGNGHESVPFVGPNAIAGQEFPDSGGGNQHMGVRVSP
jgi:murein DD-endopeptidase MepM/ murein hydrolase activator NlpD